MSKTRCRILLVMLLTPAMYLNAQWQNVALNLIDISYNPSYENAYGTMIFRDGVLWVGRDKLWKSIDTGKTWVKLASAQITTPFAITDISAFDKNTCAYTTTRGQVFITKDGGSTWRESIGPFTNLLPTMTITYLDDANNLLCSSHGAMWVSHDGGLTFKESPSFDPLGPQREATNAGSNCVRRVGKNSAYSIGITSPSGSHATAYIVASTDNGDTWTQTPGFFDVDCFAFATDPCNSNEIYVVNESAIHCEDGLSKLFYSNDAGSSWSVIASGPANGRNTFFNGSIITSQNAVFAGTDANGIMRSTDKGSTWKSIGGPTSFFDSRFLCAVNSNIIFSADKNGSIWRTINSGGDSLDVSDLGSISVRTADQSTDTIGGTVQVPIIIEGVNKPIDIDLVMHYDPSLEYLGAVSINSIDLDIQGEQWEGRSKLHLSNVIDKQIVGYANFIVFADSLNYPKVWFDSIVTGGTVFSCSNAIQNTGVCTITTPTGCGISTISKFLRTGKMPEFSIHPNPAENFIIINSSVDIDNVQIDLYDLLGKKQIGRSINLRSTDLNTINVNTLSAGTYIMKIDDNGYNVTKKVILDK